MKADFRSLLVEEFGAELGALDFERRVPEVCGRLDALIGRTVPEAKSDLDRKWGDVERRMPDYLADREREEGEHFVGIASDGFKWAVFELRNGAASTAALRLAPHPPHPHLRFAPTFRRRLEGSLDMPSLYAVTIPVFLRTLGNLDHILAKAVNSGVDDRTLVEARLIADMLPLSRQVQIASDTARFTAVRVGQAEPLALADEETTLADLRQRIARTISYLQKIDPAGFDGREDAEVILKMASGDIPFTGLSYVTDFALPNFFFHATTAYALLRANGVEIGKMDFLAGGAMRG